MGERCFFFHSFFFSSLLWSVCLSSAFSTFFFLRISDSFRRTIDRLIGHIYKMTLVDLQLNMFFYLVEQTNLAVFMLLKVDKSFPSTYSLCRALLQTSLALLDIAGNQLHDTCRMISLSILLWLPTTGVFGYF